MAQRGQSSRKSGQTAGKQSHQFQAMQAGAAQRDMHQQRSGQQQRGSQGKRKSSR